jgi:TPR repeat protein
MRIIFIFFLLLINVFADTTPEQFKDWKLKAEHGDAVAQYNVGVCYSSGMGGVIKDKIESAKWIRIAAESGHSQAQYILGNDYANGRGVTKDPIEAFKWYKKSAIQANGYGFFCLGNAYYRGKGVSKDIVEAYAHYQIAAIIKIKYADEACNTLKKEMTVAQIVAGEKRIGEIIKDYEQQCRALPRQKN